MIEGMLKPYRRKDTEIQRLRLERGIPLWDLPNWSECVAEYERLRAARKGRLYRHSSGRITLAIRLSAYRGTRVGRSYCYLHRYLAEIALGRYLEEHERVSFRNGDHTDPRPDNLLVTIQPGIKLRRVRRIAKKKVCKRCRCSCYSLVTDAADVCELCRIVVKRKRRFGRRAMSVIQKAIEMAKADYLSVGDAELEELLKDFKQAGVTDPRVVPVIVGWTFISRYGQGDGFRTSIAAAAVSEGLDALTMRCSSLQMGGKLVTYSGKVRHGG